MRKLAISVIIPVYNCEKYVARCLDSILAQTFTDFEILCVNDGSKDNSLQILRQYEFEYSCIHVIDSKNGGVSAARNLALDQARGKYIGFVDADDMIEPQMLEFLHRAAEDNPGCIAMCNYEVRTAMTNETVSYNCRVMPVEEVFPILGDAALLGLSACNKLFPANILKNLRFPIGIAMHEDVYFSCIACAKAKNVVYIDHVLYNYFPNSDSVTHVLFNPKYLSGIAGLSKCALVLKDIQNKNARPILCFCLTKLYKTIMSVRMNSQNKDYCTKKLKEEVDKECKIAFYKHLDDFLLNKGIGLKIKLAMLLFWYFPFTYKAFRKKTDGTI